MALTGFDLSLLQKKYEAMMKQADADLLRARGGVGNVSPIIGGIGSTAGDVNPLESLQAQALQSEIAKNQASTAGIKSASSIAEDQSLEQQRLNDQNYNSNTLTAEQAAAYFDMFDQTKKVGTPSYKKGTAKVPKTGAAKLHKGEAVLNKPAAEGMGRGLIAALNAAGRQKMGMV